MRKTLLYLLCFLLLSACRDTESDSNSLNGGYSFKIEYSTLKDGDTGERVATRAVTLPAYLTGYLFNGNGICTEVLSTSELSYTPQSGQIRLQTQGPASQTLYLFASNSLPDGIPQAVQGMNEEAFLALTASQGSIGRPEEFYTAKVVLNPLEGLQNLHIGLQSSKAILSLSRSSTFLIKRIVVRSVSTRSYYFVQDPFKVPADTVSRIYLPNEINAGGLAIDLPALNESKNVKVEAEGTIFGTKVSLTFNLPEVRRNNRYTLKLESPGVDPANRKLMVVVVAGQSNATGYDESSINLNGAEAPVPYLYQLGLRTSKDKDFSNNLKILPMDYCPQDMYDMRARLNTKKLHMPLGKELLKRIPAGYEVVVVEATRPSSCVTYEGCNAFGNGQFTTAEHNYGLGFYDEEQMLPTLLNTIYYWDKAGAYYKMVLNRVKYLLDMNSENKFLGIVWCQGENDAIPAWCQKHYARFDALTVAFFKDINDAGYGERCPRGTAGKHIWYNFTTTLYYLSFHTRSWADGNSEGECGQGLFGGYKLWNPDTFIRPPSTAEYTNETNGDGRTYVPKASHYGNGAYHKVVAPMIVECMDRNGGLFNGKKPVNDAYTYRMTQSEAQSRGGAVTDADVQDSLLLALPFDSPGNVTLNLAQNKTGVTVTNNGLTVSTSAFNLPGINGNRRGNTLKMQRAANKNICINFTGKNAAKGWSASCLIRRTAHQGESQQIILGNGQNSRTPYMAFRITNTKEKCGPYIEFLAAPAMNNKRDATLSGSLHNANRVRGYDEWIHYGVVYDALTKRLRIFMNGEEVDSHVFKTSLLQSTSLAVPLYLGGTDSANLGMEGELSDFFFWNKPVSEDVMYKIYLRSYWGYGKTVDVGITPDTGWD